MSSPHSLDLLSSYSLFKCFRDQQMTEGEISPLCIEIMSPGGTLTGLKVGSCEHIAVQQGSAHGLGQPLISV